jgi:NADPH2:quinone reductase
LPIRRERLSVHRGNEGSGDVVAVGSGVTDIKVGDRVAAVAPLGGYAAERILPPIAP